MITNQLQKLKEKSKKQNILIIDDLDRVDPDHLFRILNVFAAHFDSENKFFDSNKFGFDKVILVCDYDNLENIFKHKFGSNTSLAGYINKFYSNSIFRFENSKAFDELLNFTIQKFSNISSSFEILLTDLYTSGNLSLRELLKISRLNLENTIHQSIEDHTDQKFLYIFKLFSNILNYDDFKIRVQNCKDRYDGYELLSNYDFHILTKTALIELNHNNISGNSIVFYYNQKKYYIELYNLSRFRNNRYEPTKMYLIGNDGSKINITEDFTRKDFYRVLISILEEWYYKIRHFD